MRVLLILLIILTAFTVLLLIPSYLEFSFSRSEAENTARLDFKYLFFRITLVPGGKHREGKGTEAKKKTGKKTPEKPKLPLTDRLKQWKRVYRTVKDDITDLLHYAAKRLLAVNRLECKIHFGLEDPMETGIMMGVISGVVYNALAIIDHNMICRKKSVNIVPDFDSVCLEAEISGIVRVKNVHIMVMLVKLLKIFFHVKATVKER